MASIQPRQGRRPDRCLESLENNVAELLAEDMRDLELEDTAERIRNQKKSTENSKSESVDSKEKKLLSDQPKSETSMADSRINESVSSRRSHVPTVEASSTPVSGYRSWKDRMQTSDNTTTDTSNVTNTSTESVGRKSWRDRLNYDEMEKDLTRSSRTRRESLEDSTERITAPKRVSFSESTSSSTNDSTYRPWRERLSRHESIDDTSSRSWRSSAYTPSTSTSSTSSMSGVGSGSWRDRLRRHDSTDDRSSTSTWRNSLQDQDDSHYRTPSYRRASESTLYGRADIGAAQYSSNRLGLGSKYSVKSDEDRGSYTPNRYRTDHSRSEQTSESTSEYRSRYDSDLTQLERQNVNADFDVLRSSTNRREVATNAETENDLMEATGESTSSANNDQSQENTQMRDNSQSNEIRENIEQNDGEIVEQNEERETIRNEDENVEAAENIEPSQGESENVDTNIVEKEPKTWSTQDVLKLLVKAINYRSPIRDIETILKWGLDVNTPFKNGLCPLHYAAYTNHVKCLDILLRKGANINITDDIGYTPLHLAARCGHLKTMEKLIENGAMITFNEPGVEIKGMDEINKLGFTTTEPVHLAIQNFHHECAELLLQNGARPDNKYFMGYEISMAPLDDIKGIEILLKYGASPNVFNRCGLCPLMKACKDHHIDAVRLLLRYGADVNAQCPPLFEQKNVLQIAIESGNIVIVNLLLAKNPILKRHENYKYSPLHTAIMKGRADICRLLLQRKADPEERTDEGATPLMVACSKEAIKDRKEIVKMLLDCEADVNAFGPNFSYFDPYLSPLVEYLKNIGCSESFSILDLLINNGARIHFTTGDVLLGGKRDPFAVLQYAHCMANFPEVLDKTIQAAQRFNPLAIHACDSLPEDMKNTLLLVATKPLDLKHAVRLLLRQMLMPDLEDDIEELPLPGLIKSYLLFR